MKRKFLAGLLAFVIAAAILPLGLEVRAEGRADGGLSTVSAGSQHTMAITTDGTLWGWGRREFLDGSPHDRNNLTLAPLRIMENVVAVSAGENHTMAITTDGTLWGWGTNSNGQLGDGTTTDRSHPVLVKENVKAVSAGGSYTMAITTDGVLWGWGSNFRGNIGDGTTTDHHRPVRIMDNVAAVSTTLDNTTMAITTDGALWAWGENWNGVIGDGTASVLESTFPFTLLVDNNRHSPVRIKENVVAVSLRSHAMAITTDGALWGWGSGEFGQLGDGITTNRHSPVHIMDNVAAVATGNGNTMVITTDGRLQGWGHNSGGVLGVGGHSHSPVHIMDNVVAVEQGNRYATAVTTDGTLWGWGDNHAGQIGIGIDRSNIPMRVMDNIMLPTATHTPTATQAPAAAVDTISVTINNTPITFNNPPITRYGFMFFEADEVFTALADYVRWDDATRTLWGRRGDYVIGVQIDSLIYIVGGETLFHQTELTPFVYNGMIYVYIDFIVEGLGLSATWDGATRTFGITR